MSYIQVKDFGGKDRGLKFNQMSVELYRSNLNFNAIESSSIYATFFAGLTGNCYAKQEEPDFTFENVVDWVDKLITDKRVEDLKAVNDCFAETQSFKDFIERFKQAIEESVEGEEQGEDLKKKTA